MTNIRLRILAVALACGLALASATPAAAQESLWGPAEYCSSSSGCIGQQNGKNIYAPTPKLSARERNLLLQCNLTLAGALVGGASRSWQAIGAAIFGGAAGLSGPCRDLWRSTARFR